MITDRTPKRSTSFVIPEFYWRAMKRLAAEYQTTGKGKYASQQQFLDEAMELYWPVVVAEYKRVFGVSPPEDE